MKVTLVYTDPLEGFNSIGNTNLFNLGLAYIGAALRSEGHEVRLIDTRSIAGWNDFEAEIASQSPEVVGVYVSSINRDFACKAAAIAKKMGITTVAGGPHATVAPRDLLGAFDYVVQGEGELVFPELLKNLGKTHKKRIVKGRPVKDLDSLPLPDRELFDLGTLLKNPSILFPLPSPEFTLMCSRGCPFNCSFCQPTINKLFGPGVRHRSPENVVAEIKFLVEKYGARSISFQDDTFTIRRKWVFEFARLMKHEKLHEKVVWYAQSRVDTLDDELAKEMKGAGCAVICFGFESGSQRILDVLNKGTTPQQAIKAAGICKKNGLFVIADMMIGNPTETVEELEQTLALARRIRPEYLFCSVFSPIAGTHLHDYCSRKNMILARSAEEFRRENLSKIRGLDEKTLKEYVYKIDSQKMHWLQSLPLAAASLKRWASLVGLGNAGGALSDFAKANLSNNRLKAAVLGRR